MRLPHVQLRESTGVRLRRETSNSRSVTTVALRVLFKCCFGSNNEGEKKKTQGRESASPWQLKTVAVNSAAYVENCSLSNLCTIIATAAAHDRNPKEM